ncbi:MAG: gliding motility-associated ABC transporter ATP-binding subunit GldA [Flavobacteriales bacterium]|nr:gliding motility-associated ABC transporter ATP-binding subunit GldA [Flavobacteriales bacterium]
MSIDVKAVTRSFGPQMALDAVSFTIGAGEVVGFLGPNGAGKSTMMKVLTCFLPPTQGTAKVCGFDVEKQSMEVRRRVGYLPEHNPLYLDVYVREYLEFVAGVHGCRNKGGLVNEMIERVGLGPEQHKLIGALSKGYRQRVGLAQAMIHGPEVLILDEPTSGLDPNQLEEIRALILSMGKERTVMLSTHIMQEVEAICDRVIIIDRGRIVADDRVDRMRSSISASASVEVEFDGPVEREALMSIAHVIHAQRNRSGTWTLSHPVEKDIRSEVFQFAVDRGIQVLTLQKTDQGMEQVFKELTRPRRSKPEAGPQN